jgi:hypothetical protein
LNSAFNIQAYCHIKNGSVFLNGEELFQNDAEQFSVFSKAVYTKFDVNYPKFFKMDNLSKLAFLAASILLETEVISEKENDIAVILSNKASSLDTDRKYQDSISDSENYYPSPSVFVYTLPNICIGEISIKYKLHSENSFFIFDAFNPNHLWIHAENLLKSKKSEKALCGWVDFDEDNYEAFLYLVAEHGDISHNTDAIKKLYLCQ